MPRQTVRSLVVDLPELSHRLKGLRGRLGLHQSEVATEVGVPYRTFQSWENGEVQTTKENYERLADYYSDKLGEAISADQLLFGPKGPPAFPTPSSNKSLEEMLRRFEAQMHRELDEKLIALRAEFFAEHKAEIPSRKEASQ